MSAVLVELVFASSTGSWLHAGHVADRVFRPAARAAGVPWLGLHGFRHTCATALFREDGNVKEVQAGLGHHSPAFTLETSALSASTPVQEREGAGRCALPCEAVSLP